MVLKATYELYDPHFSVRHESTPPTLDQKKAYSLLLNTVGFNYPIMYPFVSRLAVSQLPTISQQILDKGPSFWFQFPASLGNRSAVDPLSTPTTFVADTRLHAEIGWRVSIRPHPRNGLACATTLKGGCAASFQTIEGLVNYIVQKYGTNYNLHLLEVHCLTLINFINYHYRLILNKKYSLVFWSNN